MPFGTTMDRLDHKFEVLLSLASLRAISDGELDYAQYLMEYHDVSPSVSDQDGDNAWYYVADFGQSNDVVDIMTWLVSNDVPINKVGCDGRTALFRYCRLGETTYSVNHIQFMLAHGAKVNIVESNGDTPLHTATRNKNYQTMRILLESGAYIDALTACGVKAYDIADPKGKEVLDLFKSKSSKEQGVVKLKEVLSELDTLLLEKVDRVKGGY